MNHLPFTILAYLFNALAILSSKFLLTSTIPDPLVYVFYLSLISFLAVLALPFTHIPTLEVFNLASLSTILWTLGAYLMFKALKLGSVSRVIPVIGTLIPLVLLVFASGSRTISALQIIAVCLLTTGMVFLTVMDWRGKLTKKEIVFEVLSALFFALSYIVLKQAYLKLDFFSVLVWSRLVLLPLAVLILLIPKLRRRISLSASLMTPSPGSPFKKIGLIFLGGQISGALSELLILFSVSLANPALVNSLQGTQYIFLFISGLLLSNKFPAIFREKYSKKVLSLKLIGIIFIGAGLYFLAFAS